MIYCGKCQQQVPMTFDTAGRFDCAGELAFDDYEEFCPMAGLSYTADVESVLRDRRRHGTSRQGTEVSDG